MKTEQGPLVHLSPLVREFLTALCDLHLTAHPHQCGGFTTDDIELQIRRVAIDPGTRFEVLDELRTRDLIRHVGHDDDCDECPCYAITEAGKEVLS